MKSKRQTCLFFGSSFKAFSRSAMASVGRESSSNATARRCKALTRFGSNSRAIVQSIMTC